MKHPHLRGKRYGNWARRSDVVQDKSIEDQLEVTNGFAVDHEMIHVKDFVFEGSGSIPGARDDVSEVLRESIENKIDVLLLHDVSYRLPTLVSVVYVPQINLAGTR